MSEQQDDEPETYDVRATQDKWLPVWDAGSRSARTTTRRGRSATR